ncbi:glycoside hydrolase [Mycena pura]|uniref:mannan endo-1,4-beta-mannosidase n=1 Tax=Mycena pura TaxID=153505 RepID=A0AAD6YNV9_9AGAR|nr:glycoside hydrolase [Mycena pura]
MKHLIFAIGFLLNLCALVKGENDELKKAVPKGFVTTRGTEFELDGSSFAFVGANSYWLPLLTTKDDVESTFSQMQEAGVKVLRTWGFNAINASELPGALESGLTYYQVWNNGDWTLNDGPQGLERLDTVINVAAKYDIRVILALTNNWVGYGGMELYVDHIDPGASTHDIFYTDSRMIASYQRYVKTIVNRYKDSSTIFAWEMMNEARCLGDLPQSAACSAASKTVPNWYKQQSDFIRSLDPNHMITTGGEGAFLYSCFVAYLIRLHLGHLFLKTKNPTLATDYNFDGQAGEDFSFDLTLPNVDFGTYHMYPQTWYPQLDFPGSNFSVEGWGLFWMDAHVNAANAAGKPLILEEFGVTGLANKTEIYPKWVQFALDTKHAIMPWQFGASGLKEDSGNRLIKYADALIDGASPNDGFAIYKNQTVWNVFAYEESNSSCRLIVNTFQKCC